MFFKSIGFGIISEPRDYCPGIDCGPLVCNHPDADKAITVDAARKENEASAKNPSPSTA